MGELEKLARRIAARKMGLTKDVFGQNLPDDLWKQAIPDANREIQQRRSDAEDLDIFGFHERDAEYDDQFESDAEFLMIYGPL